MTVVGTNGADRLRAELPELGQGAARALGAGGDDTLFGTAEPFDYDVELYGNDGNDSLISGTGELTIFFGGDGDDTIVGGASSLGFDAHGGNGNDVIRFVADDEDRFLYYEAYGDAGADRITVTGDQYALIDGGAGADTMSGGVGDNEYLVDHAGDVVIDAGGVSNSFSVGADTVSAKISFTLPDKIEVLRLTGANLTGIGNDIANFLAGGRSSLLEGRGGDDVIMASEWGWKNAADSTLKGGAGDDNLAGSLRSTLLGEAGDDTIAGLYGRDVIDGGSGADRISGGSDGDLAKGGSGDDRLTGEHGTDTLTGGAGADRFVFAALGEMGKTSYAADRITDFSRADGDRIDLAAIDAVRGGALSDAFTFIGRAGFSGAAGELHYWHARGNTYASADTDGDSKADLMIRLDGIVALTAGDFAL